MLKDTYKGSPHPVSRSSCDAGAGHVIIWPKITQLHRGDRAVLLQILSPHPPLASGPSLRGAHTQGHQRWNKGLGGGNTGRSLHTSVSWPIWENQFWPEVIPPTLGGLHRVQNTVQTTVYKPTLDKVHTVHHRCTHNCVQFKQVSKPEFCTEEYNTGVHYTVYSHYRFNITRDNCTAEYNTGVHYTVYSPTGFKHKHWQLTVYTANSKNPVWLNLTLCASVIPLHTGNHNGKTGH